MGHRGGVRGEERCYCGSHIERRGAKTGGCAAGVDRTGSSLGRVRPVITENDGPCSSQWRRWGTHLQDLAEHHVLEAAHGPLVGLVVKGLEGLQEVAVGRLVVACCWGEERAQKGRGGSDQRETEENLCRQGRGSGRGNSRWSASGSRWQWCLSAIVVSTCVSGGVTDLLRSAARPTSGPAPPVVIHSSHTPPRESDLLQPKLILKSQTTGSSDTLDKAVYCDSTIISFTAQMSFMIGVTDLHGGHDVDGVPGSPCSRQGSLGLGQVAKGVQDTGLHQVRLHLCACNKKNGP